MSILRFAANIAVLELNKKDLENARSEMEDILTDVKINNKKKIVLECCRKERKHKKRINTGEEVKK